MAERKARFEREGFLILKHFFGDAEVARVQEATDRIKKNRPVDVVVDGLEDGKRSVLALMSPAEIKNTRMKINDLYLTSAEVCGMALAEDLVEVLGELPGETPVLCNSLYFEKGSAQPPHVDSLFMTPRTAGSLIAAWVALEDSHEDAGRLEYYPKSHLIEQMKFSDGSYHAIPEEMPIWHRYMQAEIERNSFAKASFAAEKGDVFIWHAHLLHGGGQIKNFMRTRRSCVFHYFSESDARFDGCELVPANGAFWIERPPQPLPYEVAINLPFSECNYLSRYVDVANAVQDGLFKNGWEHYDKFGRREGRHPC